jgi:signal transduction histidine kinase
MQTLTAGLQWVAAIAYTLVGAIAVIDWLRRRDRPSGYLAMALGLLGAIVLMGQVQHVAGSRYPAILSYLTAVLLILSGYGLFLFRHHLIPYRRGVLVGVSLGAAAVSAWALTFPPSGSGSGATRVSPYVLAFVVVYFGWWSGMVGEPAYRLWRTSRRRPPVQRARLRALAFGYMLIVAVFILLIGLIGAIYGSGKASADAVDPLFSLGFEVLFLAAAPVLLVSFRPPGWLRRSWRAREEEGYRSATNHLLLFSPDRPTLAGRSVEWAIRLLGADGAAVFEPDGSVLASTGIAPEPLEVLATSRLEEGTLRGIDLRTSLSGVMVPMPMEAGTGRMAVVSGSFSPVFGGEEQDRLREYVTAVSVALQRVGLIEKLIESERRLHQANADLERRVEERTRQLQQSNNELSATNRELEAFSYSVSHDLRAPLRAISGFARIVMEEHAERLDPEAMEYLTDISLNAQEMGELIQDLLELSRVGRQQLARLTVAPTEVAQRALERLAAETSGRSVSVAIAEMPECLADPVLLGVVYQNLLANALKFTRDRPTAHVEVGAEAGEGPPVYFVRDDGVGFDMAYSDQLFRPFQRLHPHADYEGTGIGLAIVQRVVARHGGRVWAEGRPDAGATFCFTLSGDAGDEPG